MEVTRIVEVPEFDAYSGPSLKRHSLERTPL